MALSDSDPARLQRLATYASVSVALVLIVAKLAGYLVTHSVSLFSSLIDSSMDALASFVTLYGVRHALRPPDRAHRFGHGKAEPLAALALAAFVAGSALFLTVEAVKRLIAPQPVEQVGIGIAVLAVAVLLTGALVVFQRSVVRRTGSLAIQADSLHYRGDLAINLAVIAALLLTSWTGWLLFDPLFGLGIALWLLHGARGIAIGALNVLMDRELPAADRRRIAQIVLAHAETRDMHDLRTRSAGSRAFIELHLELDGDLSLDDAHKITDEVEQSLQSAFPEAEVIIHQEPAGLEDERLDQRIAQQARS